MAAKVQLSAELQQRIQDLTLGAPTAPWLTAGQKEQLRQEIKQLLKQKNAVLIAHYYVDDELQALAEETGGKVADSLEMANFGASHSAQTLVVIGVRFMGETAKMLSPEKTVLMPTLAATCSLDESAPAAEIAAWKAEHPDRLLVVYANTSAAVKAQADWMVTSGNALPLVSHLKDQGHPLLWAPDKHLGGWIAQETGADMLLWPGHCVVHDEFEVEALKTLITQHPQAKVLVHPESPKAVTDLAQVVGSTRVLLEAVINGNEDEYIVATDFGLFYKMQQATPHKRLIAAPTGKDQQCNACAHCPWMAMNSLVNLRDALLHHQGEIQLDAQVIRQGVIPIGRMLEFSRKAALIK